MRINYEAAIEAIAARIGIDLAQFDEDYDKQKSAIVIDPEKIKRDEAIPEAIPTVFEPSGSAIL